MADTVSQIEIDVDRNAVLSHTITAMRAQNAIEHGLTAQDIIDGVRLSHQEYVQLVRLAACYIESEKA